MTVNELRVKKYIENNMPVDAQMWIVNEYQKNEKTVATISRECNKRFNLKVYSQVIPALLRIYNVPFRDRKTVARSYLKERRARKNEI